MARVSGGNVNDAKRILEGTQREHLCLWTCSFKNPFEVGFRRIQHASMCDIAIDGSQLVNILLLKCPNMAIAGPTGSAADLSANLLAVLTA